ncbi:hypothetical protein F0562_018759 [Nyssa sinensis]|uniref:Uncharacterized protein n=1 Tax=Nyssa sinensis TaxID=561372 RepID=A0A5J4ZB48_9ASTE|nr:hypothetical protein F0562_018759 [Nyssa sinensis]
MEKEVREVGGSHSGKVDKVSRFGRSPVEEEAREVGSSHSGKVDKVSRFGRSPMEEEVGEVGSSHSGKVDKVSIFGRSPVEEEVGEVGGSHTGKVDKVSRFGRSLVEEEVNLFLWRLKRRCRRFRKGSKLGHSPSRVNSLREELSKFINHCNEVKAATAANKEGGQLSIVKPQPESTSGANK